MTMARQLDLHQVTLCCVDTRSTAQAIYALRQCMRHAKFAHVLLLGTKVVPTKACDLTGIEHIAIPDLKSINDYSHFMLKELNQYIQTPHVLVVQWDGFVTQPEFWRSQFLDYDYIGPPWYHGGSPGLVGNGGFSLRSKRLLQALSQLDFARDEPEDTAICVSHRQELEHRFGIQFAPLALAQEFGCEYGAFRPSFGFHGMHNFAHVMSEAQLSAWLDTVPDDILRAKHSRKLIKTLMQRKQHALAMRLIKARSRLFGWNGDQLNLYVRARFKQLTARETTSR